MATLLFFSILLVVTDRIKKQKEDEAASAPSSSWENPYDDEEIDPVVYFVGKPYVQKKHIETYLVIGIDSYENAEEVSGFRNHEQCDVLMLCVIDHESKTYQVLQINRDTFTKIPVLSATGTRTGTTDAQIALAHTYGSGKEDSCELTAEAVSMLLMGQKVDHYISLNLSSIAVLNSSVGGVEVTIPVDMTVEDPAMTKGATILLDDKQAEIFVRSRMKLEDDMNSSRMERQDAYLHAWRVKAKQKMNEDAAFALDLIADLSYYMVADQDLNGLSKLSGYLADYEYLGKIKIDGETKDGKDFREFYPDKDALNKVVMDLFYEEKAEN
ncbi:MAG: LCP family protein [Clostridiales bacterium]|nr:LCP family protein [Clostridiales bacterium]